MQLSPVKGIPDCIQVSPGGATKTAAKDRPAAVATEGECVYSRNGTQFRSVPSCIDERCDDAR